MQISWEERDILFYIGDPDETELMKY